MKYSHVRAVFKKQAKDSLRNPLILVIFCMFPLLSAVFKFVLPSDEFKVLVPSFANLNTVMLPVVFMSSIIAEDREKKSLRMLVMSNVKGGSYIAGVGACVFALSLISSLSFAFFLPIESFCDFACFLMSAIAGICCSMLAGAILAFIAKNQVSAGPLTAPVTMILGLLPMLSAMNADLEKFSKLFYSFYVRKSFVSLKYDSSASGIAVVGTNLTLLVLAFVFLYKTRGTRSE